MQTFPSNPGTALLKAELIELIADSDHKGMFAESVRANIRTVPNEALRMMRDQIADNEPLMVSQFGRRVIDKIKQLNCIS